MGDLRKIALEKQRERKEKAQREREEEKEKRIREFTKGWKNTFDAEPDRVEFVEENDLGGGYLLIYKDEYVFAGFSYDCFYLKVPDRGEDARDWPRIYDATGILKYYPEEPKPVEKTVEFPKIDRFGKKRLIRCNGNSDNAKKGFLRRLFG